MTATINAPSARGNPDLEAQAREQIQTLLQRSAVDMAFRSRLLTNPNAAYTESTGNAVPANVQFKFIEAREVPTIVLPAFVDSDAPIPDYELEAVSGGSEPLTVAGLIFVGCCAFAAGAWLTVQVIKAVS